LGDVNKQKDICKTTLAWLDKQAERRIISPLEQILKELIKVRYEEISTTKETIWRQRAKRQWIQLGDRNTSYFHKAASV
jgi:hypothetical protein